jgi:hypothetical protein
MRRTKRLLRSVVRREWVGGIEPEGTLNALTIGLIAVTVVLLGSLVV